MKKLVFVLIMIFSVTVSCVSCRKADEEENQPTPIPPAPETQTPTTLPDVNTNQPNPVISYFTDFENGDDGYFGGFADYPQGKEKSLTLENEVVSIPDIGSMGYKLKGSNQNNDLLMYITKGFEVLPSTYYSVSISFDIAVNIPMGTYSTNTASKENVFIKTGASNVPLATIIDSENVLRVNWDIGNNDQSGTEGNVLDNIQKHNSSNDTYEIKNIVSAYDVKSNDEGKIYIMIGVDSGVNETTEVYIDNVTVEIIEQ